MHTLGQIFRETRKSQNLTPILAAEATRIKPQTLDWMEADLWAKMPAPIYARGFIKIYAEFLGLAPDPMIEAYTRWTQSNHKQPPFIGEAELEAAPIPSPAPVPVAPPPPPPPPRSPSIPRPHPTVSPGPELAGLGWLLKYIPLGLVMILAVVLLFSGLKRWGRFPSARSVASPSTPSVSSPGHSTAIGDSSASTPRSGSTGLVLAEDPPATYFDAPH